MASAVFVHTFYLIPHFFLAPITTVYSFITFPRNGLLVFQQALFNVGGRFQRTTFFKTDKNAKARRRKDKDRSQEAGELEDADFRSLPEPTLVSARDERR